ncbi:MAG TPA: protein kinase, partial [Thermosynechococcaceae cyanobacterium]
MPPLSPGTLLHNRYCIVGVAAQGRLGQTYLARDQRRSEALCVLKEFTLPPLEPQKLRLLQQRFQVAAAALYKLNHPQLPRYQVLIFEGDRGYWVREYIEGKDYGTLLAERGAFSEAEVLHLLESLRPVLDYLHQQGMIHRDVSLENLILRDRNPLPVLINYGLVQELIAQLQAATRKFRPSPADPETDWKALTEVTIALLSGTTHPVGDREARARLLADSTFTQLLRPKHSQSTVSHPAPTRQNPRQNQRSRQVNQPTRSDAPSPSPSKFLTRPALSADPLSSAALVVSLLVLVTVASLRVLSGNPAKLEPPPAASGSVAPVASPSAATPKPDALPVPTPPPPPMGGDEEPAKLEAFHAAIPDALRDRRLQLGIDLSFFVKLADDGFYGKFPELKRRKLGKEALEKYRSEWNTIAASLLDKLQALTPETRGKLGTYQRSNYDQWVKTIGEPRRQKLDDVTDRRFYELFPEQKDKPQNPRTFGQ